MLFKNGESSLKLDIVSYEFPPYGGARILSFVIRNL